MDHLPRSRKYLPSSLDHRQNELLTDTLLQITPNRVTEPHVPVSFLLNLLWIVFGGLWMAVGWVVAALIMAITIIGLPWARAAFNIASYTLLPFGRKAVSRAEHLRPPRYRHRTVRLLGNIVWLLLAGWWLALGHLLTAILLAMTIIGIPFAWAHLQACRYRALADRQDDRRCVMSGGTNVSKHTHAV